MGARLKILLLSALLLAVVTARLCYPAAARRTRMEAARILASEINELQLAETLGRAAAQRNWPEELAEAFRAALSVRGA